MFFPCPNTTDLSHYPRFALEDACAAKHSRDLAHAIRRPWPIDASKQLAQGASLGHQLLRIYLARLLGVSRKSSLRFEMVNWLAALDRNEEVVDVHPYCIQFLV